MSTLEDELCGPPAVDTEEMAFAIALFVAAAKGRIAPPRKNHAGFSIRERPALPDDPILAGAREILKEDTDRPSDEVPLICAVSVLWHHYDQDARQQAMCSRLVAFYALMVRTRGALLEEWMVEVDSDPTSVTLSPAIVEAVATARVGESGQFDDSEFAALVDSLAKRDKPLEVQRNLSARTGKAPQRRIVPLPITDVVQQLSLHLFAFQSCVAADPDRQGTPQFRVVEQLCARVANISGSAGLQAILSRSLLATCADFPWLQSADPYSANFLKDLERIQPVPDIQEAMRCEMAILGSLIELLRSLVGDSVTVQILRSLWPLARLNFDL